MPATRPIQRDPLAGAPLLAEDRLRVRLREQPRAVPAPSLISNPLGNALAGFKTRAKARVRGGTFAPRATSGML